MKLQILLIFTLVIIGAIAHRRDDQKRWRRRPIEEVNDNNIEVEEKEVSSSSGEVDEVDEIPEDPQVQSKPKRMRCRFRHRQGGRKHFNRNNEGVENDGTENEQQNRPEGAEHDGHVKCRRRFRNRQRHHHRHEGAEGQEGHQKHNPEWHQRHNVTLPEGSSHNVLNRNREHNAEWHEAHNVPMPDVNRHRHHHHRRPHHHHHHHHNRTTTTTSTTSAPVEQSTWNVNEQELATDNDEVEVQQ